MKEKDSIIEKYQGKILAKPNYTNKYIYTVKDFSNKEGLLHFFYEYDTHEADLRKHGYDFLKEYYGLEKIADIILEESKENDLLRGLTKAELIDYIKERKYL